MNARLLSRFAIAALGALTTGCALGERPTLQAAELITDPASETVVERLDRPPVGDFDAVYTITPTATAGSPTTATVTRRGGEVRAEIGSVVFTTDATGLTTTGATDPAVASAPADSSRKLASVRSFVANRITPQRAATDESDGLTTSGSTIVSLTTGAGGGTGVAATIARRASASASASLVGPAVPPPHGCR